MKFGGVSLSPADNQHRHYAFADPVKGQRHVVVWSGGYDSTLVLAEVARRYSATATVVAVVVHSEFLGDAQTAMEAKARESFLKFAASRGWEIHVADVRFDTTRPPAAEWTVHALLGQALLWFHAVVPYLCSNDRVYWGYIRHDEYWMVRDRLVRALEACTDAAFITGVTFEYPLAGAEKHDVVRVLRELGVPTEDLWTCDSPHRDANGSFTPCKECQKCRALNVAVATVDRETESRTRAAEQISRAPLLPQVSHIQEAVTNGLDAPFVEAVTRLTREVGKTRSISPKKRRAKR